MRAIRYPLLALATHVRAFRSTPSTRTPLTIRKMSSANRVEQIRNLLKSIETGESGPVAVVNEAVYIQHNPQTHEGSEGLASLFKRLSKTNPKVNMVRGFQDGEYVFAHMEYDFSSRKICFEVFRFENDQAVEHWDNLQPRMGPNSSGRSMVDGPTEVTDLSETEPNRALVRNFVQDVLVYGKLEQLGTYVNESLYAEHDPNLSDDLSLFKQGITRNANGSRSIDYQTIHRVLCQGNFAMCVTEGYRDSVHTSFYDLFRVENSKIVEHWDTTETVVPQSEWKNNNGKF